MPYSISINIYNRNKHYISVNKIMPGENARPRCKRNFTLPNPNKCDFYRKWNRDMINIITKDGIITPGFKSRIEKNKVFKCEKHFDSDQI